MIVYLHVGAPKTGTTYVQRLLWNNRRALADDGVCYPGDHWQEHYRASLDLRGTYFKGYRDPNVPGAWGRLVEQVRRWDGQVAIIDHELFGRAAAEQVDRALSDLKFADVHIVYTVRDLARQIPAMWQESVKNGATFTFTDFLASVRNPEGQGSAGQRFWQSNDYAEVLDRWSRNLPPSHVHVITVPESGSPRGLLWERFASVAGLDPHRYAAGDVETNASLGAAEVGALRRLNLATSGKDIDWPTYAASVKGLLGHRVLAGRPGRQKIALPPGEHAWIHTHAEETIRRLTDAGYDIVGDLAELLPGRPVEQADIALADDVSAEEQLEAAAEAMAGLLERIASLRQRNTALKKRATQHARRARGLNNQVSRVQTQRDRALAHARRVREITGKHKQLPAAERVKRAVVEVGDHVRVVGRGLTAYRRIRALIRSR